MFTRFSTQEGAFEGGEYGPGPQGMQPGMMPNEQMQPGPYGGGYGPGPEETMHRPRFMPFRK